jgi:dTDP-4-dehydrorhamnose 3,5-epimerase
VLEDNTETSYQVGEFYTPGVEGGLSPFDPGLGLTWPLEVTEISEKDSGWAPLAEVKDELERRMAKLEGAAL